MCHWLKKITVILTTGYILFFYSERMFWSFLRPGDTLVDLTLGWVAYSLMAWVFLLLIRQCRIAAFPAVFLAGSVFGWTAEGVVVDTLYGNSTSPFPVSISFTGLAWHALISVIIGWYWQARVLASGHWLKIALFSVAIGLGWGLWAGWWPAELGKENTSLTAFAFHTVVCFIPFLLAWMVLSLAKTGWFRPARLEMPILVGLAALFFFTVRVPATPRSVLILPPLLLACAYGLDRSYKHEQRPDLLDGFLTKLRPISCVPLLLMPLTAVGVYAIIAKCGWTLTTNVILYEVTMPLGFICLLWSLWALHRLGR